MLREEQKRKTKYKEKRMGTFSNNSNQALMPSILDKAFKGEL